MILKGNKIYNIPGWGEYSIGATEDGEHKYKFSFIETTSKQGIGFFRGLYIWIPTMLVVYALIFFSFNAFADDEFYFYGVIKTNLIKITESHIEEIEGEEVEVIDREYIKPDVPFMLYSYYAVSGGKSVTYTQDLKNEGKEIMALIAVKREDEEALKAWSGYIGDDFDTIKNGQVYQKHYPLTIEQEKTTYTDLGVAIPYLGVDKDDPARFAMWDK